MKRILVIGCPGAGKSTFARALRDRTGLPLWYLDQIWHRPDRTTISRAEFDARLTGLLRGDAWIIDGNYLRTLELRLRAADTVFLLDYPTGVCLEGARARIGTKREDLPWVEEEFDPDDPDGKRGKSPAMGGGVSVEKDEPGRYTDYKPTRIPTETPKLPEPFESLDKTWGY